MKLFCPAIFFCIFLFSLSLKSDSWEIRSLKKVSYQKGELYKVSVSPRLRDLIQKSVKAISKRPFWLKNYMKKNDGEGAIPWHKNLGVTKKEYKFMMDEGNEQFSLNKLGESSVSIVQEEGLYKVYIEGPSSLAFHFTISKDLKTMTLKGFEGSGRFDTKGRLLEPILAGQGLRWKIHNVYNLQLERLTGKIGEITYIELDNKRDCAFSIRLKGANEGRVILNYQFVVKYACVHNI